MRSRALDARSTTYDPETYDAFPSIPPGRAALGQHATVQRQASGRSREPLNLVAWNAPVTTLERNMPWNRRDIERIEWVPTTNVVPGFLPWRTLDARKDIAVGHPRWEHRAHQYSGVYMFAQEAKLDGRVARWLDSKIMYVGKSHRELGSRLDEYETWIPAHWGLQVSDICVTLMPIWFGEDDEPQDLAAEFVLYAERRLIWEHRKAGHELRNRS